MVRSKFRMSLHHSLLLVFLVGCHCLAENISPTIIVPVGKGTLSAAIRAAQAGAVLKLSEGEYTEVGPLVITQAVSLTGQGNRTVIAVKPTSQNPSVLLEATTLSVSLDGVLIKAADGGAASTCAPEEPFSTTTTLSDEWPLALPRSAVRGDFMSIRAELPPWRARQMLVGVTVGSCTRSFSMFGDDDDNGDDGAHAPQLSTDISPLTNASLRLQITRGCTGVVTFDLPLRETARVCGFREKHGDSPTGSGVARYDTTVNFAVQDRVQYARPGLPLFSAITTHSTAKGRLQIFVSSSRNVSATTHVLSPFAVDDVSASLARLDLMAVVGNTTGTVIAVALKIPQSLAVELGATSTISFVPDTHSGSGISPTPMRWTAVSGCSDDPACDVLLTFTMGGCARAGTYEIGPVPVGCNGGDSTCTLTGTAHVNVSLSLAGGGLCEGNGTAPAARFNISARTMEDATYNKPRVASSANGGALVFPLGQTAYWALAIAPSRPNSHIRLLHARVVSWTANTTGTCSDSNGTAHTNNVTAFDQRYGDTNGVPVVTISTRLNAEIACPLPTSSNSQVRLRVKFNILVEYVDDGLSVVTDMLGNVATSNQGSSANTRREADTTGGGRSGGAEWWARTTMETVEEDVVVVYAKQDADDYNNPRLAGEQNASAAGASASNSTTIIVASVCGVLGACCLGCFCLVVTVACRRRQRVKQDPKFEINKSTEPLRSCLVLRENDYSDPFQLQYGISSMSASGDQLPCLANHTGMVRSNTMSQLSLASGAVPSALNASTIQRVHSASWAVLPQATPNGILGTPAHIAQGSLRAHMQQPLSYNSATISNSPGRFVHAPVEALPTATMSTDFAHFVYGGVTASPTGLSGVANGIMTPRPPSRGRTGTSTLCSPNRGAGQVGVRRGCGLRSTSMDSLAVARHHSAGSPAAVRIPSPAQATTFTFPPVSGPTVFPLVSSTPTIHSMSQPVPAYQLQQHGGVSHASSNLSLGMANSLSAQNRSGSNMITVQSPRPIVTTMAPQNRPLGSRSMQ